MTTNLLTNLDSLQYFFHSKIRVGGGNQHMAILLGHNCLSPYVLGAGQEGPRQAWKICRCYKRILRCSLELEASSTEVIVARSKWS